MSDVTGALHHEFGGRSYTLRLTLGGIGKLQGKHGNDLGGLLTGGIQGIPPFSLMIDVVAVALEKGERMSSDEAQDVADDIITADQSVFEKLMKAAFPDPSGKRKAPKAAA